MVTTDVERWIAAALAGRAGTHVHFAVLRDGASSARRATSTSSPSTGGSRSATPGTPVRLGNGREHRGEVPAAPPRVRDARHAARRVQDRREERARPRGARRDSRRVRGHPPQAHGRPRRRAPRFRLVRGDRRRLAGGEGSARAQARAASVRLLRRPVSPAELEQEMFEQRQRHRTRPRRLGRRRPPEERGVELRDDDAELVLLCVPDRAIAEVAAAIEPGPWVAHVSGATPLARARPARAPLLRPPAADVHRSTAGRSSSTAPGRRSPPRATRRARSAASSRDTLGLRPFDLDDDARARSTTRARRSPRTTSSRSTAPPSRLFEDAGAPPEALVPLMTRTIENGFELTGPIARGDWAVVDAHLARAPRRAPGARADVPRARGGDAAP